MRGIRKYKTFLEARLDMYKEMWERGFQEKRVSKLLKDFDKSLKEFNLPASRSLYQPGIYLFESLDDAQKDVEARIKKNDNT